MPTSFASYDSNQDGQISAEEWAAVYGALDQGPMTPRGGGSYDFDGDGVAEEYTFLGADAPQAAFNLDEFIAKMTSGNFTDDDLIAFSNWYMGQQIGQQAGQLDYQNRYLEYLNSQLGLNEQQLAQAQQEMAFQQGPYWEWYTTQYFPHQQERDKMEFELAGLNLTTQKELAGIEKGKAKDYALAQFYNTEQAKYGADAARWQFLQQTGQSPVQAQESSRPMYREPRLARDVLGIY
jgi:hypothetical protein